MAIEVNRRYLIFVAIWAGRVTFAPEKSGWPKKNKIYCSFIAFAF
jgi:hypothetical protein